MTRSRNKRCPRELAERLARGSHAKDFGIRGKPVLFRVGSRGSSTVAVRRLEVRSSLDGSKDKNRELITKQTAPLTSGSFSIAVDGVVPPDIEIHSLPAEAQRLAPQLRGFGYIVVEEQIALVDQRTRKVELVFPRWGE